MTRLSSFARPALLAGTALVAAVIATPALASGFNGTVVSATGATVNVTNDDITINGTEAVIDWNANGTSAADTSVSFLSSSGSVLFHDSPVSSAGNFTVLNRVTPVFGATNLTVPITISGAVSSTVFGKTGGNVWFYSPYGIVTDGTASFNVGGLLLTTSDIDQSSGSLYFSQSGGQTIKFLKPSLGAGVPDASIQINGSTITAVGDSTSPTSAYVGIFSNRIVQGGTIASSGATALVAAQEGTLTFNLGQVDFAITTGSTDSQGIVHTGTTGGPASAGEVRNIALVAMPQNQAMTMLLQGSIGYTPAASATPDGSAVILNAGYDPTGTLTAGLGNINIGQATISNSLTAQATGTINIAPGGGTTSFLGDANLSAGKAVDVTAGAGDTISVGGGLGLSSLFQDTPADVSITVSGTAASPGLISVTNGLNIDVSASATGAVDVPPLNGQSVTGGTATINVSQGALTIGSGLTASADARAGLGSGTGGTGTAGVISIIAGPGGTISDTDTSLSAVGYGGDGSTGGDGLGGTITLTANGGSLALSAVDLRADAVGGYYYDPNGTGGTTGNGLGGQIGINILGGAQSWSSLTATATASAGYDGSGLSAFGSSTAKTDAITLHVSSNTSSLTVSGDLSFDASAYAPTGSTAAHTATGGTSSILVDGAAALTVNGAFNVLADATPSGELSAFEPAYGPTMNAGSVSVIADGGTISANVVGLSATATGVAGSAGAGAATGGNVTLGAQNGGTFQLTGAGALLELRAEARGASGPFAADANGGTALLYAQDGTVDVTGAPILVSATAYSGGNDFFPLDSFAIMNGYSAKGGTATAEVRAGTLGTGKILAGDLSVTAKGDATEVPFNATPDAVNLPKAFTNTYISGIQGNGGTGTGGLAAVNVAGGTLTTNSTTVAALGVGGSSDTAGTSYVSGDGFGGTANFNQSGGTFTTGQLTLEAIGHGGGLVATADGSALPLAGAGHGGRAVASLSGGTLNATLGITIDASAIGGDGFSTFAGTPAADGGAADARLAVASLLMPTGSTATLTAPSIDVIARGIGGNAGVNAAGQLGNGGAASGGTASYSVSDGSFDAGTLTAQADAQGGTGTVGGDATGGTASFAFDDAHAATPGRLHRIGSLALTASPTGGFGTTNGTTTAGATSFVATVSDATAPLQITGDLTADANGAISPVGDGFTLTLGAVPVLVGGNFIVSTTRDISGSIATGGGITAAGGLSLDARKIAITGSGTLSGGVGASVTALQSISLGGLSSGGTTILTAQDPAGPTEGPVSVANLNSAGLVRVLGSAVTIGSTGSLSFEDAQATTGNLSITTGGNLTLQIAGAAGALTTVSGGTLAIGGTVRGATISATSADIQLGADATLGRRGVTSTVALVNSSPGAGTFIGGTGQSGAWSLSATELGQVYADNSLTISTGTAASPADVVIGPLALAYGGAATGANLGTNGTFAVNTSGRIRVIGGVALTSNSAGDTFSLSANAIDVVGDAGVITMLDSNGGLSGQLNLRASTIRAASATALSDISAAGSLPAISARLDTNDGTVRNGGFFQAGQIAFNATTGLYIQNTGASSAYADRRGFTANAVAIQTSGPSTQIAINGVVIGSTGTPITGLATQKALTVNGAALAVGGPFHPSSTVNGCLIGLDCNTPPSVATPPKDIIDVLPEPPGGTGGALEKLDMPIVSFGEFPSFNSPPLIDEPVTGVGNDDLWQQQCNAETDCHG